MTLPACDRIIELAEKATPGPWQYVTEPEPHVRSESGLSTVAIVNHVGQTGRANAKLIAESRTLAPKIASALNEAVRAIEEAPHASGCASILDRFRPFKAATCSCWKRTALDQINGLLK